MNEMIQWLESKITEYHRDAEYSDRMMRNADYLDGRTRCFHATRNVVYTSVYRDLERKVMELKALHPCPTTT